MINGNELTLLLYVFMRMTGFVLFNPLFGRRTFPGIFKAGLILMMTISVRALYSGTVVAPSSVLELAVRLLLELSLGFLVATIMHIFFYIPEMAGFMADEQMGMAMAKTYDAGSQSSLTSTASLLNMMMILLFFSANGHHTLLWLMLGSGQLVPFGAVELGELVANRVILLFIECSLLAVKMCLPILATELLGQLGVGILMKAIPQINVFAINIEIKVIVGMVMLFLLLAPFSEFLLQMEVKMLHEIQSALSLAT